jgi:adenylylsulfate kinase
MTNDQTQVVWHPAAISRDQRERLHGHEGCVVWFTGLSGCGKSTVANEVDRLLFERGLQSFVLDGDNVRHGLNASPAKLRGFGEAFAQRFGLTFSSEDRQENIRRIAAVAELFASAGIITLTAFVSPYRADRALARSLVEASRPQSFVEVFVDTPLEVCEARDPKGLYKQARAGELKHFTGIDDPYEPPQNAELRLLGAKDSPQLLAAQVVEYLEKSGKIPQKT